MSDPAAGLPEPLNLTDPFWVQLQAITEQLAAAYSEHQVDQVILTLGRRALGALSGVILLTEGDQLRVAFSQGSDPLTRSIWTDRPLSDRSPATDALRNRQPAFFEHMGALCAVYPEVETQTHGTVAVASAVVPIFLGEDPMGVLVLDFAEPHAFKPGERYFLLTLAAQGALALNRVHAQHSQDAAIRQLQASEARFRRMVDASPVAVAVGSLDGNLVMVNDAYLALIGYTRVEFDAGEIDWQALTPPEEQAQDTEMFARAFDQGVSPPYLKTMLTKAGERRRVRVRLLRHEEDARVLVIGYLEDVTEQLAKQQRLEQANVDMQCQVMLSMEELLIKTRALEGFAALSRDLSLDLDPVALVGRAQEILVDLLPDSVSTYYESHGSMWQLQSHRGVFHNPALLQALSRGLPRGQNSNVDRAFETGAPYYQDRHDPASVPAAQEEIVVIHTSAALPVFIAGSPRGVLVVGLHQEQPWTSVEHTLLDTIARNLGFALERAEGIAQLTEERRKLAAANEELEAFNYSVSHDLMTPVRHVSGFAQLAGQNLDDQAKVRHYLGIVSQGATRMETLIEAMLQLSRMSRRDLNQGMVDLNALVEEARLVTIVEQGDHRIDWRLSPMPLVWGDRVTLQQVMTNLLGNAVKYSAGMEPAVVEVWSDEDERSWTISVRDNGAGFDLRYAEKLFGIFQRLHRHDEFAGTGVGLAIVRRIIARHGGTVSATGEVGKGATFSFTLPKQQM